MKNKYQLLPFLFVGNIYASNNPNIVIIVADDLGWGDVGFNGSDIRTPILDSLAYDCNSVLLKRFYAAPISTATRVGLMTGLYPSRFGLRTAVIPPWRKDGLDTKVKTLADYLGDEGYKNRAIIGKWHLGHSKKEYYPLERGFTHFYGHLNGAIDYFTHEREGELDWHNDWESCYDKGYSTDLITQESVKCIKKYKNDGPFFLYVAYNAPHSPLQAKECDIKQYVENIDSLSGKELKAVTFKAMVSCMDRGIGDIMQTLKAEGLMDNTLLLFMSDNGTAKVPGSSSGILRGSKFTEWDGGVRVPAILNWSKLNCNKDNMSIQLCSFVDIVPTIRDILGQDYKSDMTDGVSLLPLLNGSIKTLNRYVYLGCGSVISNEYKLVQAGKNPRIKIKEDFLIEWKNDESEKVNIKNGKVYLELKSIAERYDTIKPSIPEVPYEAGRDGFIAPKEWKIN